jgi:hypothetical protein
MSGKRARQVKSATDHANASGTCRAKLACIGSREGTLDPVASSSPARGQVISTLDGYLLEICDTQTRGTVHGFAGGRPSTDRVSRVQLIRGRRRKPENRTCSVLLVLLSGRVWRPPVENDQISVNWPANYRTEILGIVSDSICV